MPLPATLKSFRKLGVRRAGINRGYMLPFWNLVDEADIDVIAGCLSLESPIAILHNPR